MNHMPRLKKDQPCQRDKKKWTKVKWPHRRFEKNELLNGKSLTFVAGCDEVGRGALAGPVVAAVVIWPTKILLAEKKPRWALEIKDSKLLSSQQREKLFPIIKKNSHSYALGVVSAQIIDEINILRATKLAISQAVERLREQHIFISTLFLDNLQIPSLPSTIRQKSIVKGDRRCFSIAAASIIAKVMRDRMMKKWHEEKIYQPYQFYRNKGYGVPLHKKVLKEKGTSFLHRQTFTRFLQS